MLNHVMIGSNDIERAKAFYDAVLGGVLGVRAPIENKNKTGQTRLFYIHDGSTFSVTEPINGEPVTTANGSTIGFVCNSPEQLKEFHDVAVANGGTSVEDPPGPRENAKGAIYLCYFLDPDGHKICGLHRPSRA
jgi:catechol 2,3-dioxygenase-like lactoylglutathione lyase family enzyme